MEGMEPRERKEVWLANTAIIYELEELTNKYSSEDAKTGEVSLEELQEIYKKSIDMAAGFEKLLRDKEAENENS